MNKSILVTGAEGFIGSRLMSELERCKIDAVVLPRQIDISDPNAFSVFQDKKISAVVHLASLCSVPESWERPLDYYRVNLMGTIHALEFCRQTGAQLIFPSSYMYGTPHYLPIDESHPLAVNNPYAQTKLFAEETARFYAHNYHIPVTILRLFNVYGPAQKSAFLIPLIVQQVIREEEVTLQTLEPRRDFVHLTDVVHAFVLALEHPQDYLCVNVGSGESYSVREVVTMTQQIAKTNKPVKGLGISRQNEIDNVVANCSKIKHTLGWTAKVSLMEGLSELVALERAEYERTIHSHQ